MKRRLRWRRLEGDYHAFNRGVRRLRIFADDEDRGYFLRLIGVTARKHAVVLTAWCLMDNHYHLTVRSGGARMGRMIRDLEKTYARYYNKKTGHTGALFEGRFGSVWIPDLRALAYVTRYVHSNGRDKGVAPELYPWSSCRAYLGLAEPPFWLDTRPVLEHIGGAAAYRRYLSDVPPLKKRATELEEAQGVLVEHIRERAQLALRRLPEGACSWQAMAGWVALRLFELRPRVVAPLLGYASGHCLSNVVCRFQKRLDENPDLRRTLEQCW